MRPLTLHASALNDEEYDLYTSSILDLALYDSNQSTGARDDAFYEQITVSVRETRAWLRGRYPTVPVTRIDAILKFFFSELSHGDTLSGGQFFAVLRLVVHAQNGRDVDRSLAFVQARLSSLRKSASDNVAPPQLPRRSMDSSVYSTIPESGANPFQQPPLHPSSQRLDNSKSTTTHSPNNPFVTRSTRSEDGSSKIPPLPPRKPSSSTQSPMPPAPPPRHATTHVSSPTPVRLYPPQPSVLRVSPSSTPQAYAPPVPPPLLKAKPPPPPMHPPAPATHVTSTLMKQSLQASKAAQTMKKAEEQLERERVLQVLRSSAVGPTQRHGTHSRSPSRQAPTSTMGAKSDSGTSASYSGSDEWNSIERERPPLPRRRPQQQPRRHSPPLSTNSLEQVALAVPPSLSHPSPLNRRHTSNSQPQTPYTASPFDSPTRPSLDLPLAPPTHPDRKPSLPYMAAHMDDQPHSPTSSSAKSPFRRNLESFEAVYGTGTSPSSPSPATANATTFTLSADSPTMSTPIPATSASDTFPNQGQQKMGRSRSLHHPSPTSASASAGRSVSGSANENTLLPPPPPKHGLKKRPESMQLLTNGEVLFGSGGNGTVASGASTSTSANFDANNALKNSITQQPYPSPMSGHKRSPYSSSFSGPSSTITGMSDGSSGYEATTGIQRKFAELQLNAMPVFEKARYKAEAGLSRRGFVQGNGSSASSSSALGGLRRSGSTGRSQRSGDREDREGLLGTTEYSDEDAEDGMVGPSVDDSDGSDEGCARKEREMVVGERDDLKWPVGPGEGWKMLR